ncbi:MAG: divergent polysaccharide deacetylase family protein [Pseudomonadota bacterium]
MAGPVFYLLTLFFEKRISDQQSQRTRTFRLRTETKSMAAKPRRKFRAPVVSRLTLAWASAAAGAFLLAGFALWPTLMGGSGDRISLAVNEVETLARPQAEFAPAEETSGGLRLAAPGLREAPEKTSEEAAEVAADQLIYPENAENILIEEGAPADFDPEDIVITIAGGDQRTVSATAASVTPVLRARPVAEPDPALLRTSAFGKVPQIAPDGRQALHVYRNRFEGADGRPQVALIMGGLGLNKSLTERAIDELPAEVSLAFAPYAKDLDFWAEKARRAGHEVLIELPMESYGGNAAALGSAGLLTTRTPEQNLERLEWLMSRFSGYFAATNYLGGKFSANAEALTPVISKLRASGVAYIDDTGAGAGVANQSGAVIASVNRILPPAPDDAGRAAVRRELERLKKIAKRDGAALGKTYAYGATIEEIERWAANLEDEGFAIAPASAALPSRYASR